METSYATAKPSPATMKSPSASVTTTTLGKNRLWCPSKRDTRNYNAKNSQQGGFFHFSYLRSKRFGACPRRRVQRTSEAILRRRLPGVKLSKVT